MSLRFCCVPLLLSCLASAQSLPPPPGGHRGAPEHHRSARNTRESSSTDKPRVTIHSSVHCRVYVDDESVGVVHAGGRLRFKAEPGDHELRAETRDGREWTHSVHLTAGNKPLELRAVFPARQAVRPPAPAPAPQPATSQITQAEIAAQMRQMQDAKDSQDRLQKLRQKLKAAQQQQVVPSVASAVAAGAQTDSDYQRKLRAARARMHEEEVREERAQLAHADAIRPAGTAQVNATDKNIYVWVPAGSFQMGCVTGDQACSDDEKPSHTVILSHGFWIGARPVSVEAYTNFAAAQHLPMPSDPVDPDHSDESFNPSWSLTDHPIVGVSYDQAAQYCQWMGGHLPSEAQWEYAARYGLPSGQIYLTAKRIDHDHANYGTHSCCHGKKSGKDKWRETSPVGSFDPTSLGLYDMSGNVWEWTRDFYGPSYYAISPDQDPHGPADGTYHVLRGGAWNSPYEQLRLSARQPGDGTVITPAIGFRCIVPGLG